MTLRPFRVVLLFFASCLASVAAASDPAATSPAPAPTTANPAKKKPAPKKPEVAPVWKLGELPLQKGMPSAEVRRLLGEPDRIKAGSTPQGPGEVWVYRRAVDVQTWEIPNGTRPEGRLNYATGKFEMVEVPVFREEFHQIFDTVVLMLVEQKLAEWRRTAQVAKEALN